MLLLLRLCRCGGDLVDHGVTGQTRSAHGAIHLVGCGRLRRAGGGAGAQQHFWAYGLDTCPHAEQDALQTGQIKCQTACEPALVVSGCPARSVLSLPDQPPHAHTRLHALPLTRLYHHRMYFAVQRLTIGGASLMYICATEPRLLLLLRDNLGVMIAVRPCGTGKGAALGMGNRNEFLSTKVGMGMVG